jgi:hypothetical protein
MTTVEAVIASPVLKKIRMEGVDAMEEEGEVTVSFC